MVRLTKQSDYGILVLTHLASAKAGIKLTAKEVAKVARLPLPMVSKVLKLLARKNLLVSHRGTKGGYSLSKEPHTISIADILNLLDGPLSMTECVDHASSHCNVEPSCPVRTNWHRINSAVENALSAIKLSDMVRPLPPLTFGGMTPLPSAKAA